MDGHHTDTEHNQPLAPESRPGTAGSDVQAIVQWRMRDWSECLRLFATVEAAEAAIVEWHNAQWRDEPPVTTAEDAMDSAAERGHSVFIFTPDTDTEPRMFG